MIKKVSILAGFVGMSLISTISFAQTTSFNSDEPSLNRKVRNLGMGNTGVALTGTADSSPFYNPAGLNDLEKGRFQFFSITGDFTKNSFDLISDVNNFVDDVEAAATSGDKVKVLDDFIKSQSGEFNHVRFAIDIFNYAGKNFAAGLLVDEKLDLAVRGEDHFDIRNFGDAAFYIAGAHDFWNKILQVGITLKPTLRFALDEGDQRIDATDVVGEDTNGDPLISGQFKNISDLRFGMGIDLGLKSNLGFPGFKDLPGVSYLRPEIGFTWQDIGSPSFDKAESNPQTLNAGMAIHTDVWKLKNSIALDFRDLNRDQEFLTKVHFGVESVFDFPVNFGIRAGLSQGYITGGVTVDLWVVKVDTAVYYEEVGVKTKSQGNLRLAGTLSFNI